jgi:hypothetical protein
MTDVVFYGSPGADSLLMIAAEDVVVHKTLPVLGWLLLPMA